MLSSLTRRALRLPSALEYAQNAMVYETLRPLMTFCLSSSATVPVTMSTPRPLQPQLPPHPHPCMTYTPRSKFSTTTTTTAATTTTTNVNTDIQSKLDAINDKFVEARDEIAYAQEDAGTTYFNESYDDAKALVDAVLEEWRVVVDGVDQETKGKIQRSMGLKMEQLKAELAQLDTLHD